MDTYCQLFTLLCNVTVCFIRHKRCRNFILYLLWWQHKRVTSERLLKKIALGSSTISIFLFKHKLCLLELVLNGLYLPFILKDIPYFWLGDKLWKIFNKNTLKFSFYSMPNLKAKINGHNDKIFKNVPPPKAKSCHCLRQENFPMTGNCFTENILYYGKISFTFKKYKPKLWRVICEATFRRCYANHIFFLIRTKKNYLLNTRSNQWTNFLQGYTAI